MTSSSPVLISWIAVNNDPFERLKSGDFDLKDGQPTPGPTLTLLFDKDSPYFGRIKNVVFLYRALKHSGDKCVESREERAVRETIEELKRVDRNIHVSCEMWSGEDPTDHKGIFEFLREQIPAIRKRFPTNELILHISPGTPSMQTIWVLMAETGYIDKPFQMVKSYRKNERGNRPPVVPVKIDIDTFYKVFKSSFPKDFTSSATMVLWDPAKFKTSIMKSIYEEARRFAQVNVPVLILGERGTGKSTLAYWMRMHSSYCKEDAGDTWPVVACGQYTPELMRSELFGHSKGAFTGAISKKIGLLASADRDTLFLDEIGDVSKDVQRLLIKAVEEKQFSPVGDSGMIKSDFRLISATNLDEETLFKRLDPDFRDRISLFTLRLPPLREIPEELPWLWESTFSIAISRSGVGKRHIQLAEQHHDRVVAKLKLHPLPGNIRDLFRVAYRIVAARGDEHAPLPPDAAIDYGLQGLVNPVGSPSERRVSQVVARAYSENTPLDSVLDSYSSIPIKVIERDFQRYLASEIRRICKASGKDIKDICDLSERSLRTKAKKS